MRDIVVTYSTIANDLFLRAAKRQFTERTPVWLMRQAGRVDPEYRALRQRADLPLAALFKDADLAAEISLLPKRWGVDAIILFQDILTPLGPMGANFTFRPGPILSSPIRTCQEADQLRPYDVQRDLSFVSRTLELLKTTLNGELPVLGFAGAPMTLAFFLIEGKSPGQSACTTRAFMKDNSIGLHRLLDKLADLTIDYLMMQINAGADAVQLFESCAHLLAPEEYKEFAHRYQVKILSQLSGRVPTVLFVRDQPWLELMADSGADVLSVGSCVDLSAAMNQFGDQVAFQGNVDNHLVATASPEEVEQAVHTCVRAGGRRGHILNLSHGLLPDTPFENVLRFVDAARETAGQPGVCGASRC